MKEKVGLADAAGWLHCPFCNSKTRTKVANNTVLKNFPLYCPKCGHETIIDFNEAHLQLEPDAKTQSRYL